MLTSMGADMKYRLVIFDLDGTLLDTIGDLCSSTNHALQEYGLPERTLAEVQSFVGNGMRRLIERSVPEGTDPGVVDLVFQEFHRYYKLHSSDHTKVYDGVMELLEELKQKGYHLAVVSSKADYAVQELCRHYFGDLFEICIGDQEGIRRKPDPEPVLRAIGYFGLQPEETVYVGDSEVDILTAANTGVDCISVEWGFRTRQQLLDAGASVIISRPSQLPELV